MAIALAPVTGTVYSPSGLAAAGGRILVRLSQPGKVVDGSVDHVVGGQFTVQIGSNGAVSFNIVPNDSITPAGTSYVATYVLNDGTRFEKAWTVTGAGAKDIGDL